MRNTFIDFSFTGMQEEDDEEKSFEDDTESTSDVLFFLAAMERGKVPNVLLTSTVQMKFSPSFGAAKFAAFRFRRLLFHRGAGF